MLVLTKGVPNQSDQAGGRGKPGYSRAATRGANYTLIVLHCDSQLGRRCANASAACRTWFVVATNVNASRA